MMALMGAPANLVESSEATRTCPWSCLRIAGCSGSSPCVGHACCCASTRRDRLDDHACEAWRVMGVLYGNGYGVVQTGAGVCKHSCESNMGPLVSSFMLTATASARGTPCRWPWWGIMVVSFWGYLKLTGRFPSYGDT